MKEVFVLLRRIYDPYGCLEDNEMEIIGIFDNMELAEQNQKQKQQRNKEHQKETYFTNNFEYWIDTYNINEVDKDM